MRWTRFLLFGGVLMLATTLVAILLVPNGPASASAWTRVENADSEAGGEALTRSVDVEATALRTSRFTEVPTEKGNASRPEPGSLIVEIVSAIDGAPVPGIGVDIEPWTLAAVAPQHVVTAATGQASFTGLSAGLWRIATDRGERSAAVLGNDAGAVVRIVLTGGLTVTGIVMDAGGAAVDGAELWYAPDVDLDKGTVLGPSGSDGTFQLTGLREGGLVGARTKDLGASPLHRLGATEPAGPPKIELFLPRITATIAGLALDPLRQPVAGALVRCSPAAARRVSVGEAVPEQRTPHASRSTDPGGAFTLAGLAPIPHALTITAEGFAPFTKIITPLELRSVPSEFILERGATIEGTVRTQDGGIPTMARITATSGSDAPSVETRSDAEGRFRLDGLASGAVIVAANLGASMASTLVTLAAGGTATCELILPAARIRVRVLSEGGEGLPRAAYEVRATGSPVPAWAHGLAGVDGRFEADVASAGSVDVALGVIAGDVFLPWVVRHDVIPGGPELAITIPACRLAPAQVSGRLLAPHGAPLRARISAWPEEGSGRAPTAESDPKDGGFLLGALVPGRYRLEARASGLAPRMLATVELASGIPLDLGTIRFEADGRLELLVVDLDGEPINALRAFFTSPISGAPPVMNQGRLVAERLASGTHTLALASEATGTSFHEFRIEPGSTHRSRLVLEAASERLIILAGFPPSADHEHQLFITDDRGRAVADLSLDLDPTGAPTAIPIRLAPGTFRARVHATGRTLLTATLSLELATHQPVLLRAP